MKYMGSKRAMLQNGLGELLRHESKAHRRIVDLFCGSASVSWFAAQQLRKPVLAVDLQKYATVLASAIIQRTKPFDAENVQMKWFAAAKDRARAYGVWKDATKLDESDLTMRQWSKTARELCRDRSPRGAFVWKAYGGHYFSPSQSLKFDAMRATLPAKAEMWNVCLASLIMAASKCAAAPGHTAQPFSPTKTASPFLLEAWKRDPFDVVGSALADVCPRHAHRHGEIRVADASDIADGLRSSDLVFLDPPYSGVHYSRFYHVLETIARGECSKVEGVGRYPPPRERPVSLYSQQTESLNALDGLLSSLSEVGCTAILTFPSGKCSNGLSGKVVEEVAKAHFEVFKKTVKTRFSTMGGDNDHRKARHLTDEMILLLRPI